MEKFLVYSNLVGRSLTPHQWGPSSTLTSFPYVRTNPSFKGKEVEGLHMEGVWRDGLYGSQTQQDPRGTGGGESTSPE